GAQVAATSRSSRGGSPPRMPRAAIRVRPRRRDCTGAPRLPAACRHTSTEAVESPRRAPCPARPERPRVPARAPRNDVPQRGAAVERIKLHATAGAVRRARQTGGIRPIPVLMSDARGYSREERRTVPGQTLHSERRRVGAGYQLEVVHERPRVRLVEQTAELGVRRMREVGFEPGAIVELDQTAVLEILRL